MSSKTASPVRDPELAPTRLAELEAMVTRQQALIELLLAERAERQTPRSATRPKRPPAATAPDPEGQPTSRRGLLKRLGASAAGAAVAATALGAARPERAVAQANVTVVGNSTNQYGVLAARQTVTLPGIPAGARAGVIGVGNTAANLDPFPLPNDWGVVGTTNQGGGVLGICNPGGTGVMGISGAAGPLSVSFQSTAVLGTSNVTDGVCGASSTYHGVYGQTAAAAGAVVPLSGPGPFNPGNGLLAAGVTGRTSSTVALYGYADGPPNPSYAPVGAVGQCENGFGVWGLSSAGPGAAARPGGGADTGISGVLGTSTNGLGVYAISSGAYALAADGKGPSTVGALIRGLGGGRAAVFVGNVEINGHLTVTGGINGPVAAAQADSSSASAGARSLQGVQSREALVEEIGEGRLVGGRAAVRFDAALSALLGDDPYQVVLTEYDDHHGLYVTARTRQGFEVRAKDSPTASGAFGYRVVGRSSGSRAAGDQAVPPLHVPTLPVPQGVPTLPVGPQPATPERGPSPR